MSDTAILGMNFNSRPSARGDARDLIISSSSSISIHAPPRGATLIFLLGKNGCEISIHAPPRGATLPVPAAEETVNYFNSRPSARGDFGAWQCGYIVPDFNSRPSARGDACGSKYRPQHPISIHAPPRGATEDAGEWLKVETEFQFTPLREGRLRRAKPGEKAEAISIHAPPRGATDCITIGAIGSRISIHAPPRGATPCRGYKARTRAFQFTPLREGRLASAIRKSPGRYFNSRPSARGDAVFVHILGG